MGVRRGARQFICSPGHSQFELEKSLFDPSVVIHGAHNIAATGVSWVSENFPKLTTTCLQVVYRPPVVRITLRRWPTTTFFGCRACFRCACCRAGTPSKLEFEPAAGCAGTN